MHNITELNRPPGYHSVAEVAEITGLTVRQLHRIIRAGKLRPIRKSHYFFISPEELDRFKRTQALKSMPLDVFDYARGCGPAPEVV